jgi:hypothetical protein
MTNPNSRHVVQNPDGGWHVKAPVPAAHPRTATLRPKRSSRARNHSLRGGGEVVIHGRDGRIRDSDTLSPGRDPFPPRDSK